MSLCMFMYSIFLNDMILINLKTRYAVYLSFFPLLLQHFAFQLYYNTLAEKHRTTH